VGKKKASKVGKAVTITVAGVSGKTYIFLGVITNGIGGRNSRARRGTVPLESPEIPLKNSRKEAGGRSTLLDYLQSGGSGPTEEESLSHRSATEGGDKTTSREGTELN